MKRFPFAILGAGAALALLIVGCKSTGTAFNPPHGSGGSTQLNHMYLSISAPSGAVQVYNMPVTSSSTPAASIPAVYPEELFVDSKGRLFVPITGGTNEGTVQVYDSPVTTQSTPAFALTAGGASNYPEDVAEDSSGNVYVSLPFHTPECCLAEFASEAIGSGQSLSQPSLLVPSNGTTFGAPFGLAVDGNNNLFVSDRAGAGALLQFPTPVSSTSTPTAAVAGSTDFNYGIVVDKSNRIYISNLTACGSIDVFNEPVTSTSTPAFVVAVYPGAACGTNHSIIGMAFDGSGDLWVATFQHEVLEVPAPISASSTPQKVLSGLPNGLWGIAFGP